ncbi:hypothetical protein Pmani_032471 [Petrolisthes manimaculis]|uniref:FBA domain-containing protein n=1 Tax=Petrolisthes manimaculis TaxID=1843537 RepID=A0AAE1NRN0_9EUCA|nr:hypothetical protein Pmani_032471 [Petrolisthes manimaculis]
MFAHIMSSFKNAIEGRGTCGVNTDNGYNWCGHLIPEDVIINIFTYVPAKDLIKSGVIVCKYWHHLLNCQHFWFLKLKTDGVRLSNARRQRLQSEEDERKIIYIIQGLCSGKLPFNQNLILNPCGRDRFEHWRVGHGGDRIVIECPPVGSDEIPREASVPTQHCFVTSYYPGTRIQVIDLEKRGINAWIMDILKPEIHISEWVSARWDCNSQSFVEVRLQRVDEGEIEVNMEWSSLDNDIVCRKWYKISRVIEDYPEGINNIIYSSTGQDHQYWAGHYGAKTAGSSVVLVI